MSSVVFAVPPCPAWGWSWYLAIRVIRIPSSFGIQIFPWYHKRSSFHRNSPTAISFTFAFSFVQASFAILDFFVDLDGLVYFSFVFVLKLCCFQWFEFDFFGVGDVAVLCLFVLRFSYSL